MQSLGGPRGRVRGRHLAVEDNGRIYLRVKGVLVAAQAAVRTLVAAKN